MGTGGLTHRNLGGGLTVCVGVTGRNWGAWIDRNWSSCLIGNGEISGGNWRGGCWQLETVTSGRLPFWWSGKTSLRSQS